MRHNREVLRDGGEIHFKTDNRNLYEWSLFQFPKAGYSLTEISRDLHRDGIQGIMTDYEEKFHLQGVPINRCVAVKGELPLRSLESKLSDRLTRWQVRRLAEEDRPAAARLLGAESAAEVEELLAPLPPRAREEQRRCLGVWDQGRLICLLACLEDCPGDGFLWLSRLIVAEDSRRAGVGRAVVSALKDCAADMDWKELRLSCPPEEDSRPFWVALGFCPRPDREGDWQRCVLSWRPDRPEEEAGPAGREEG